MDGLRQRCRSVRSVACTTKDDLVAVGVVMGIILRGATGRRVLAGWVAGRRRGLLDGQVCCKAA